jgi:hypothetical protein
MSTPKQLGITDAISAVAGGTANQAGSFLSALGNVLNTYGVKPLSNAAQYGTFTPSSADVAGLAARHAASEATEARQSGGNIWAAGLGGLGAGVALTRLQQLLSSANKPDIKYKKFISGPQDVDETEKFSAAPAAPTPGILNSVVSAPGNFINAMADDPENRKSWLTALMLGGSGLGLYGGHKLMQQIAQKQHKEELQDTVEDAKKEYQRALIGKRASADLEAAFNLFEKAAAGESMLPAALQPVVSILDTAQWPLKRTGLHQAYWMANAGLGALSAKMVYDWTRERGKDKALAEAQKARARLAGAPSIYIDPEQLAKIKAVAS